MHKSDLRECEVEPLRCGMHNYIGPTKHRRVGLFGLVSVGESIPGWLGGEAQGEHHFVGTSYGGDETVALGG